MESYPSCFDKVSNFICKLVILVLISLCVGVICFEIKEQEAKTYLVRVELPTGQIETYEVDEYDRYFGGGYFFQLMDGRTLSVQSNNIVVEEIKKEEEVIK